MIVPSNEAEAPIRTKTKEKPKTYDTVDKNTFLLISVLQSLVNSSMEKPVIKVKYDGIIGRIQGEKKERSPAKKAAGYVTVSINIIATGLTCISHQPSLPEMQGEVHEAIVYYCECASTWQVR